MENNLSQQELAEKEKEEKEVLAHILSYTHFSKTRIKAASKRNTNF